jgi:hypothetical protein
MISWQPASSLWLVEFKGVSNFPMGIPIISKIILGNDVPGMFRFTSSGSQPRHSPQGPEEGQSQLGRGASPKERCSGWPRSAESRGTRCSGNSWKPRYIGKTLSFFWNWENYGPCVWAEHWKWFAREFISCRVSRKRWGHGPNFVCIYIHSYTWINNLCKIIARNPKQQ